MEQQKTFIYTRLFKLLITINIVLFFTIMSAIAASSYLNISRYGIKANLASNEGLYNYSSTEHTIIETRIEGDKAIQLFSDDFSATPGLEVGSGYINKDKPWYLYQVNQINDVTSNIEFDVRGNSMLVIKALKNYSSGQINMGSTDNYISIEPERLYDLSGTFKPDNAGKFIVAIRFADFKKRIIAGSDIILYSSPMTSYKDNNSLILKPPKNAYWSEIIITVSEANIGTKYYIDDIKLSEYKGESINIYKGFNIKNFNSLQNNLLTEENSKNFNYAVTIPNEYNQDVSLIKLNSCTPYDYLDNNGERRYLFEIGCVKDLSETSLSLNLNNTLIAPTIKFNLSKRNNVVSQINGEYYIFMTVYIMTLIFPIAYVIIISRKRLYIDKRYEERISSN